MRIGLVSLLVLVAGAGALQATTGAQDPQGQRLVFRAGVDCVAVATTVRTRRGKSVTNLKTEDFKLFDTGQERAITELRSDASPVSVALLVDYSGSMDVSEKREAARAAAAHLVSWLAPGADEIGLYAFDSTLRELAPLGPAPGNVLDQLRAVRPFGATSLFDAIAETGRRLASKGGTRRAVVALTDGIDNASALSAAEVSGLASSMDVPVYISIIVSPLDRADKGVVDDAKLDAQMHGRLADLAHWTGGEIFAALGPAQDSEAAQQIVTELRHQYLIVFEPDTRPGWHPIDIRTKQKDLIVRARSGYVVQGRPEHQ